MEKDNYENHIHMLQDFKQGLVTLKRNLQIINEKYQQQIDMMEGAGFVEDIVNSLRQKSQAFSAKIEEVNRQLEEHNHKIEMQTEALTALRTIAKVN